MQYQLSQSDKNQIYQGLVLETKKALKAYKKAKQAYEHSLHVSYEMADGGLYIREFTGKLMDSKQAQYEAALKVENDYWENYI